MKPIRLNLGKEWYYFDHTQRFRPVGNKTNFVNGALLYKDSEFFLVHKKKKIFPNVDFYAAIVLNALDIPKQFFTLFFASSRITGWVTHILEQYSDSVLLRPTSRYIGAYGTKFIPIDKR